MIKVARRGKKVIMTREQDEWFGIMTIKSIDYFGSVEQAQDYAKRCREFLKRNPSANIDTTQLLVNRG